MPDSGAYDALVMDHIRHARNFRVIDFMKLIDRCADSPSQDLSVEQLAIRETVLRFASRARCAALPWATLEAALNEQDTAVVR